MEELDDRLKKSGNYTEEAMPEVLKAAQDDVELSKSGDFYDATVVSDDLETAYKALEEIIYGPSAEANGVNGDNATAEEDDIAMKDAANGEVETNGS
jgi:guanylate kinase